MHAGALGWVAMISIGSLYHLIPKVFGRPQMHSIGLINAHFWLATIGTVLYIASMWVNGITQGLMYWTYTPSTPIANGTVVNVVAQDAAGNSSPGASVTVDSQAPAAPVVNPSNGTTLSGTAEPGATVTLTDGNGNPIGQVTADGSGNSMRSVSHQMNMAKLPMHRDLAGFDFSASSADARLISELASLAFTDTAQNVVLIGGPGTGKTHLATALAVSGITRHGKRVRFYSTVSGVSYPLTISSTACGRPRRLTWTIADIFPTLKSMPTNSVSPGCTVSCEALRVRS